MIEINLLPGAGRKSKRGGSRSFDMAATMTSMREKVRDPWLLGAIAATTLALLVVGVLFLRQSSRQTTVDALMQKAVQDSTRYASVLKERERAEAKRDTVLRSLNLIRAIDDDRFIWPHVLDEISRALPPYTWIISLGFTGTPQGQSAVTTLAPSGPPDSSGKRKKRTVQTVIPRDTVHLRLVGNTVDIQALTQFMRQLEASPFLEQIQLAKSERANDNGKEVTQFQLDMLYSRPDPTLVRRVPLAVSVR